VTVSVLLWPASTVLAAIPGIVIWSYSVGAVVFAAWLATTVQRGDWSRARGLDRAILLGPVFYAVPLGAFGTEHFTLAGIIASLIPAWIPWHPFWTYLLGGCFIAAALSLVTRIQARLAASLLAATFLLFVLLMDLPGWAQDPRDRFALTIALRQLAFSGGALALAASLTPPDRKPGPNVLATVARYFVGVPVVVFGFQQFMHADHVPGVPLNRLTPSYVLGHSFWTYLAAVVYVLAGVLLLVGKRTRAAATWIGLTVLVVVLAVYVPIAVVDRASLGNGLNYLFDTLMFCGVVFLLAGAMPREEWQREPSARSLQPSS